ncbi:tyrosine-type recombinase/integrase [Tardiphaga robiniae]|uniref:Integrase n=1 Tax=Tardiphaga robiniae TaxID=943830 RepID=A0A163ZV17_9BRAD|nr:integrase arm-type DNA-binding domain-containing protein [Tardiphaga robiniae]KZD23896.1 integrase [Tardiphaga robiniae]
MGGPTGIQIRRKHPDKALNVLAIRAIDKPGRYADGNGLYLKVDSSGAKRWELRTVVRGKRCDIGLGGLKAVTLAEAREQARKYRAMARNDEDPLAEKRLARKVVPTFRVAAETVHKAHAKAWKNAKHGDQWINTLKTYAYPAFGDRRIDQIDTPEILKALSPIWLTKQETARRVRQRIGTVLDWAKAAGFRSGNNPVEEISKALPRQSERKGHHAAIPYAEVPAFVRGLAGADVATIPDLAFEFLILTAARTGEVLEARWEEIDLDQAAWTIPAGRMKAGREHRVPMAPRCIELLARAKQLAAGSAFIFPGRSGKKPMSNMVLLMAMRRLKSPFTVHGFRSAFRDWASERTNFAREICEAALAHIVKDKTEAAYRRGDLFEKRRELMDTWAAFVASANADIVPLRRIG